MTRWMKNRETVLVVGAGGFIGTHVTRALVARNFNVRTLSPDVLSGHDTAHFCGRTTDCEIADAALVGCDRVIYLGGSSTPGHAASDTGDEVERELSPLLRFAEHAGAAGCRQFIFTSSGGTVYGVTDTEVIGESHYLQPISIYGVNKLAGEHYLRLVGRKLDMAVLTLRLSNPYGPGQRVKRNQGFVAAAMEAAFLGMPLLIWGDGSTMRDYVYIDDVASAYVAVCQNEPGSGTFNVASGRGTSLADICRLVEQATGVSLDTRYEPGRDVDIPHNVLSIDLAQDKLKWRPQTCLELGMKHTKEWWCKARL